MKCAASIPSQTCLSYQSVITSPSFIHGNVTVLHGKCDFAVSKWASCNHGDCPTLDIQLRSWIILISFYLTYIPTATCVQQLLASEKTEKEQLLMLQEQEELCTFRYAGGSAVSAWIHTPNRLFLTRPEVSGQILQTIYLQSEYTL